MELRQLRSFAVLADERHFGRAAARLHLAQPALSQQIKQLERELGVALFTRTTRRVELTEAGTRFTDHVRAVLADLDRARDDMATLASGFSGRVSVGFIGTATYDVLPRVALEVGRALPDLELDLRGEVLSPHLVEGLVNGTFDLALVRPESNSTVDLDLHVLRTEQLVAVLPKGHPLARRRRIGLEALAKEDFVMHPSASRSSIHDRVLDACRAAGFEPASIREVSETATLVVFVAAGLGVALVPEPVRALGLEGVSYVPLVRAPTIDLALATRRGPAPPAVRRVADVVANCFL